MAERAGLHISAALSRDTYTIRLIGELDLSTNARLANTLRSALAADRVAHIVIDADELRFIDSIAIGILARAAIDARDRRIDLRLENPHGLVDTVLRITGIAPLIGMPEQPDDPAPTGT
jgi:anti-anti-sigma factor